MAEQVLDGGDVGAGVEKVASEGGAQVVRRERRDSRLGSAGEEQLVDRLRGERGDAELARAVDRVKSGPAPEPRTARSSSTASHAASCT